MHRANILTAAATDTPLRTKHKLRSAGLRFRIGAPSATKGAPFQKYGGPNPRSIVNAEALYVENQAHSHLPVTDQPHTFR